MIENIEVMMGRIAEIQKKIGSFQRPVVRQTDFRDMVRGTPDQKIDSAIDRTARRFDMDKDLIRSVIDVESGFNPKAVSDKGARGLMQLMPETARNLGVEDVEDIDANIEGGSRYLSQLLGKYANRLDLALAAYNAGPEAVDRSGNRIPEYEETQNYVRKVMEKYKQYQELK